MAQNSPPSEGGLRSSTATIVANHRGPPAGAILSPTLRETRRCQIAAVAIVGFLISVASARGQELAQTLSATYNFSIAGAPISKGTLWLYFYGWGYLDRRELGQVTNGSVDVRLTAETLRETRKGENPKAYLVALDAPGIGWFRSPDFTDPSHDLIGAIDKLGALTERGLVRAVTIPSPVRQTIRLLNADGTVRPGVEIDLATYVTKANHCGMHESLTSDEQPRRREMPTLVTDAHGEAEFVAPLAALYLDLGFFKEHPSSGIRWLEQDQGIQLEPAREHVVQRIWDRMSDRAFRVRVTRPDGRPIRAVHWRRSENSNSCGTGTVAPWELELESNDRGEIAVEFAPEHTDLIWLELDGVNGRRQLSDDETGRLYQTGEVTIVWDPRKQ